MDKAEKTLGLRERKKLQTYNAILKEAWKLFSEKGFDSVKVAEIADAANISVKTLFTYFSSKEDIVFAGENEIISSISSAFKERKDDEDLIEIEKKLIDRLIKSDDSSSKFENDQLIDIVSKTPSIMSRLLIMWKSYEDELSNILKNDERLNLTDIEVQVVAINLILPFRLLFDFKIKYGQLSEEKTENILKDIFPLLENGIRNLI